MGALGQLVRAILNQSPENPTTPLSNPAQWLIDWVSGGGDTFAGVKVNELNAVRSSAVFRCLSLISNLVASLPLGVYKRTPDGRVPAFDHPVHRILHDRPNRITTPSAFKRFLTLGLLTNGNGYAVIGRNQGGNVLDLMQVAPQAVTPERVGDLNGYRLKYDVRLDGQVFHPSEDQIVHVPGLGFDGVKGISVISAVARQSVGLDVALEELTARLAGRGLRPSGILEQNRGMKPEALNRLRAAFEGTYGGLHEAGSTIVLDQGMKWTPISISPQDAQIIESRRYQVSDIGRIFGVPLFLLNETEKSTSWGTGIEQQMKGLIVITIGPWLVAIEEELNRKLLAPPYYCKFNIGGMMRGDSKAQSEYFQRMISYGVMTPNEVREVLELPRAEGGDRLFIAGNLRPIDEPYTKTTGGGSNDATIPSDEPN